MLECYISTRVRYGVQRVGLPPISNVLLPAGRSMDTFCSPGEPSGNLKSRDVVMIDGAGVVDVMAFRVCLVRKSVVEIFSQ